jgi:DNA repair protein RadA/Sms
MTDRGLGEVANPSALFLTERPEGIPGSTVLAAVEGSRPLMVEIQALVGEPTQGSPRRTALGVDVNRVAMLLAVLRRAAEIDASSRDVFVNVTGGISVVEPAADLAVAVAVVSSAYGRPVPGNLVVIGEIGLTGEVRNVARMETRLREAARLGFNEALAPPGAADVHAPEGMRVRAVRHVSDAVALLFS